MYVRVCVCMRVYVCACACVYVHVYTEGGMCVRVCVWKWGPINKLLTEEPAHPAVT